MGKLILARHHESEWNKLGKWTGITDVHLSEYGFEKSKDMGLILQDVEIDYAFASMQVRSIETLSCMLDVCKKLNRQFISAELNKKYCDIINSRLSNGFIVSKYKLLNGKKRT